MMVNRRLADDASVESRMHDQVMFREESMLYAKDQGRRRSRIQHAPDEAG
jgi:hypothetical protein